MTQSEIYDRIIAEIIRDWHYDEHADMDKTVAKIREVACAYWSYTNDNGLFFKQFLKENYPQYYKELTK